jgi:putative transcriptional regulator
MVKIVLDPMLARAEITYYRLAVEAKLNHGTMHKIRHGLIKEIKLDVLDRICSVLRCEPGELFVRVPDKKGKK